MKIKKLLNDIKKLEEAEPGFEYGKAAATGLIKQIISTINTANQGIKDSLSKISSAKDGSAVVTQLQSVSSDVNRLADRLQDAGNSLRTSVSKYLGRR